METNRGIQVMCALLTGTVDQLGATPVPLSANNAYIHVGDNLGTVPTPTPTDVKLSTIVNSGTNFLDMKMVTGFPTVAGQTMSWEIQATSTQANFAWNEWGLANGTISQVNTSGSGKYLFNHKGIALGTKASGQTWSFQAQITQS